MSQEVADLDDLKELGEGRLGAKVFDKNDNLKEHHEYRRVKGDGSVKLEKKVGQSPKVKLEKQIGQAPKWVLVNRRKLSNQR